MTEEEKIKRKEYQKAYREKNKEKIREYQRKYREDNSEIKKEKAREYYLQNKEEICAKVKEYRDNNKDVISLKKKKYNKDNKEKIADYQKKYRLENHDKLKEYDNKRNLDPERLAKIKEYRLSEKGKAQRRETRKKSIYDVWRSVLHNSLKRLGKDKEGRTIDLLGYSAVELKEHIERQFTEGMSWDNHGEWHIDHIYPLSKFDDNTPINVVNSLDNLQPLWENDNLSKSNKIL